MSLTARMKIRRTAAILAFALALVACGPSETETANVAALARAMALSTGESAIIVKQLRTLASASVTEGQHTYEGKNIPSRLQVLQPVAVVVSPRLTRIQLSGEGDDQVYLLLREKGAGPDGIPHGELIIVKGKNKGSEVWWRD